jgi:hypothetical protein
MRCLVTAGKHVNDTRGIARQLPGKRVPTATDTHVTGEALLDYNNGNGDLSRFLYIIFEISINSKDLIFPEFKDSHCNFL